MTNDNLGNQHIAQGQCEQNNISGGQQTIYRNTYNYILVERDLLGPLIKDFPVLGDRLDSSATSKWLQTQLSSYQFKPQERHNEALSQIVSSTGEWIFNTNKVKRWQDDSHVNRHLAIQGVLGSGKSVLLSQIIQYVQQKVKGTPKIAIAYFYLSYGDVEQPPLFKLWACLLEQLLQQSALGDIAPSLKAKFESRPYGDNSICPSEHISLFIEQCSMFKTVYVVIDALDVYWKHPSDKTQQTIYESFPKLPSNVRVLFSSRNGDFAKRLDVQSRLHVAPKTNDIEAYVKSRVQNISHLSNLHGTEKKLIMDKIIRQTNDSEMFLLAKLHLNRLETDTSLRTPNDMLECLTINTNDLAQAFKPSIDRIMGSKPSDKSLARHVLTWVIHSKQDLARDLLLEALEISQSRNNDHKEWHLETDSLLHVCYGLVILDSEKGTFRLTHDSIRQCESMAELRLSQLEAEIARICLEALLSKNIDNYSNLLLSYSASFWALHLRSVGRDIDRNLDDLTRRFLLSTPEVTRALSLVPMIDPGCEIRNITGLHAAAFFDMSDWIRRLGKHDIHIDEVSADGKTALHWAVAHGRRGSVIELLARGAKPNIQDSSKETPLHKLPRGSTEICLNIAHDLIKNEADVTVLSKGQSPLSLAIRYGPTSLARLFIESQRDVNTEISSGWTSLKELFFHGCDIGKWLRDQGGGSGQSRRGGEVKKHLHGLLDLLLERGVRLNEPTTDGWLPLPAAVSIGSASIVEKLLRHQPNPADSNLRDGQTGETPLYRAITYERRKEARLLLQYGSNVNEDNEKGWKPLIHLCEKDEHELAQAVIEKGARLDDIDSKGLSALSYAVKNNNKDIAWLLITKGADVNIPGPKSIQNIERALQHDDFSIAWLLCEHGAAVEGRDEKGTTLLHRASHEGNLRKVQFLMDRGLALSTGDEDGQTPLHHAVEGGSEKVVHLLASRNTGSKILDKPDHNGSSALMLATLKMNFPMVRALLRHGASCEVRDHKGLAPIHSAAQLGWLEGLSLFIPQMKDVNMTDNLGNTAVHRAVYGGKIDIIRHLASEKASLEVLNNSGCSPLMAAVLQDSPDIVWALLQAGANIHRIGKNGCTAIDYASYRGTSRSMNIFQMVLNLPWSQNDPHGS